MSLFGDDQGRTEKPTPGRLDEARNRGDTRLSRELVTAGTLLAAAVALRALGAWLFDGLSRTLQHGLSVDLQQHPIATADVGGACRELWLCVSLVTWPLATLLAILVLACAVFGYGQIGFRRANQVLGFKLERLDPVANCKKLFNLQALVRTGFALLKVLVLAAVLWLVLRGRWAVLANLANQPFVLAVDTVAGLAFTVMLWVGVVVMLFALVDVIWQRFDFQQRNMMTRQEVEDERRRSEGDPMIKNRLRQARLELLRHRMMEAVPKADVILTNPTHYAVALRYDRKQNAAPEVVAKGVDAMALRIRELAREHDVPLMEDPPLARALYRAVKVGDEVPAKFYEAVATVLSHVYRLRERVA